MLTTTEFAALLGIKRRTVAKQCRLGVIKATKRGRDWMISESEIEPYRLNHLGRPGVRGKKLIG